jgi:two-component system response regulator VicR
MKKILVVEDDYTVATMLYYILVGEGFEVDVAHDGEEAIEKFDKGSPDLILSDVMIPKRNGFRFARFVREGSDIPIVFLTSLCNEEHRKKGLDAGANDYITKPFDPHELVSRLKKLLGLKGKKFAGAESSI